MAKSLLEGKKRAFFDPESLFRTNFFLVVILNTILRVSCRCCTPKKEALVVQLQTIIIFL